MECEDLAAGLTEFMEGNLDAATEAEALDHLATCRRCETVLAETREVIDLARSHGHETVSAEDRSRLLATLLRQVDQTSK